MTSPRKTKTIRTRRLDATTGEKIVFTYRKRLGGNSEIHLDKKLLPVGQGLQFLSKAQINELSFYCQSNSHFSSTLSALDLCVRYIALKVNDPSLTEEKAAELFAVPEGNLARFANKFILNGLPGLIPSYKLCGRRRRPSAEDPQISRFEIAGILTASSSSLATSRIRAYAMSPECRPDLREALIKAYNSRDSWFRDLVSKIKRYMAVGVSVELLTAE